MRKILVRLAMLPLLASVPAVAQQSDLSIAVAGFSRGKEGERITVVCPPKRDYGRVFGTDVYTDDSSICGAAAHAGIIKSSEGGVATAVITRGQKSYRGSTRNGITSADYAAWTGSFTVERGDGGTIGWKTKASGLELLKEPLAVVCPPGGTAGPVWGSDTYTDDSPICAAAVHAGLITADRGGRVVVRAAGNRLSFPATTRNGVKSQGYGNWPRSFCFEGSAVGGPGSSAAGAAPAGGAAVGGLGRAAGGLGQLAGMRRSCGRAPSAGEAAAESGSAQWDATAGGSAIAGGAAEAGGAASGSPNSDPSPPPEVTKRYRVSVLGLQVISDTGDDDLFKSDGKRDEVYIAALVCTTMRPADGTPAPLPVCQPTPRRSVVHGDVLNYPQRVKAGSASPTGGIQSGDVVGLGPSGTTTGISAANITFPLVLWEGTLSLGKEAVWISPSLWESDKNEQALLGWQTGIASAVQAANDTSLRVWQALGGSFKFSEIDRNKRCGLVMPMGFDRPIGAMRFPSETLPAGLSCIALGLTREKAEAVFTAGAQEQGKPVGVMTIEFKDGIFGNLVNQFFGHYLMYIKLEVVP